MYKIILGGIVLFVGIIIPLIITLVNPGYININPSFGVSYMDIFIRAVIGGTLIKYGHKEIKNGKN